MFSLFLEGAPSKVLDQRAYLRVIFIHGKICVIGGKISSVPKS